jgi:hypothetical protein
MSYLPDVMIKAVAHGLFPLAASLNNKVDPSSPILKVTLQIRWNPGDSGSRLAFIERQLRTLSPSFEHHQCRGLKRYRVFNKGRSRRGGDSPGPPRVPSRTPRQSGIEPSMALAHLIEHAIIDFLSFITGVTRCSGATGALADQPDHFDLLVECRDLRAGQCALALAVTWLCWAAGGGSVGRAERDALAAARFALNHGNESLYYTAVARRLDWSESRAESALSTLFDLGCLGRSVFTMNFSNIPEYHVTEIGAESPASTVDSGPLRQKTQSA